MKAGDRPRAAPASARPIAGGARQEPKGGVTGISRLKPDQWLIRIWERTGLAGEVRISQFTGHQCNALYVSDDNSVRAIRLIDPLIGLRGITGPTAGANFQISGCNQAPPRRQTRRYANAVAGGNVCNVERSACIDGLRKSHSGCRAGSCRIPLGRYERHRNFEWHQNRGDAETVVE